MNKLLSCFFVFFLAFSLNAQNFNVAVNKILPSGVQLGMSVEALKQVRANLHDGLVGKNPNAQEQQFFSIFIDSENIGMV